MESKYSVNMEEISENTSHRLILDRITPGSSVLECGCASGYMTRYMKERLDADVSIIEMNPSDYNEAREYAGDGICANLEGADWSDYYQGRTFDYVMFADVLEHLRNPEDVLKRAARFLKEDGTIIASIPNVAHADILINQLNGRWNYTSLGLLDNTHIRFWAEKNLDDLFQQAGLSIVNKDYTILPPFTTEQKNEDKTESLLPAIHALCHQPFADVYQFVYCAKKAAYVTQNSIACVDHYSERHSTYWTEPPCCLEYRETQNRLAEQQAERERLIQTRQARIVQLEAQNRQLTETAQAEHAQIERLKAQNRQLGETTEAQRAHIAQIEEQNRQIQESFDTISNSTCWKITKPVRAMLDFLKIRNRTPVIRLFVNSLRVYGIRATAEKTRQYLKRRTMKAEPAKRPEEKQELIEESRNQRRSLTADPLPVDVTVSVIIPTFNGGKDLPGLLALLLKQVGLRGIEIIVVDSGSTDDTLTIAADFGAKIIQITQAEFSHSFARNLGAKHACGEYLLFMSQDAKPVSEHWVRDMAQPILRGVAVAVSCREEPRDDCDLLARFSIWIHSRYMGILEQDRILSMPANQSCHAMRKNGQLSDVACMIRSDVFSQFEFRRDFAEDLDNGLRLIRAGYRLALLASAPVVHSHTRPAYYHLKRCLMDMTVLKQLLPDFPVEQIAADTAMNRIIGMIAAVWHYVRELTEATNIPTERKRFFAWSVRFFDGEKQKLQVLSYEDFASIIGQKPPTCDERFHDFVQDLYGRASESFRVNTDWLDIRRNNILIELNDYLVYTGEPFTGETIAQIAELFVKHCGQVAGETLAFYTMAHGQETSFLNDWARGLRHGI